MAPGRVIAIVLTVVGIALTGLAVAGTAGNWGASTRTKTDGASATVTSAAVTSTTASNGDEAVQDFLDRLADAVRSGDVDFQVERLHPAVIDRYGEDQCRSFFESRTDPTRAYAVTSVAPDPQPFDYATDGGSETIDGTTVVHATVTQDGQTGPATLHLAELDDELTYFVDCGEPS